MLIPNPGRTLYHGTVIDHKASIEELGLIPVLGDFVRDSYGCEFDDDTLEGVVFAADKEGIEGAVGAMRYHVGKKLGKWLTDVDQEDMRKHGMLVIIKDITPPYYSWEEPGETWTKAPPWHERRHTDPGTYPPSVEGGDWFLTHEMGSTIDVILTGRKMMRFLRRMGALEAIETDKRRQLIKMLVKAHPEVPRAEIIRKVGESDWIDIRHYYYLYRDMLEKGLVETTTGWQMY